MKQVYVSYITENMRKRDATTHLVGVYLKNDIKKCCLDTLEILLEFGFVFDNDRFEDELQHRVEEDEEDYVENKKWENNYREVYLKKQWNPPNGDDFKYLNNMILEYSNSYLDAGWTWNVELVNVCE
jgi:hypothetical protein